MMQFADARAGRPATRRAMALGFAALGMATGACAAAATTADPPPPVAPPPDAVHAPAATPAAGTLVKHVVIIVQENRSTDNLFHGLPGADIADHGVDSKGRIVKLTPVNLAARYGLGHSHRDFVRAYDGGKLDGWDREIVDCNKSKCPKNAVFRYVKPGEVKPYFDLATQYAFADRMFQSNQGPSYPAHQYLIAGTSKPSDTGPWQDYFVATNPKDPDRPTGCVDAPESETVQLLDPAGAWGPRIYPCFEHGTLMDLLDASDHSWNYYTPNSQGIWAGPNSIEHLRTGPDWDRVVVPQTQVLLDIQGGVLPDVSWVIPSVAASDHANSNKGTGPAWVASVVNAIGTSRYWSDTVILITWDDWGGWFDHVAPPIHSSYESGFRVPLIVVSPYAKRGYVSHVPHSFGSLLRFVEWAYQLPTLGYEDARSDDLHDCFDFTQSPRLFVPIVADHDGAWFVREAATQSPDGPDDD